MLQRIKERLEWRMLIGVEIRLGKDGVGLINACSMKLSGDLLSVVSKKENLKNLTHFSKHFKPGFIAVCLSGRGVLTKEVKSGSLSDKQVVQQVMPNANVDDFYFQLYSREGQTVVSLVRRSTADGVLMELANLGFQIVSLNLGDMDDEAAYKAAFQVLLNEEINEVKELRFANNRRQMFAKTKVQRIAVVFAGMLFTLLIINFLLSGYFTRRAEELAFTSNASGVEIRKFQEMEARVVQKGRLITTAGWAGGYSLAWLTDRLMLSKPAAITLLHLTINPLIIEKTPGVATEEKYEVRKIVVSGLCDQASTLNNWLYEIRSKGFVAECSINHYELNKESGKGRFTIHITVNDYEG